MCHAPGESTGGVDSAPRICACGLLMSMAPGGVCVDGALYRAQSWSRGRARRATRRAMQVRPVRLSPLPSPPPPRHQHQLCHRPSLREHRRGPEGTPPWSPDPPARGHVKPRVHAKTPFWDFPMRVGADHPAATPPPPARPPSRSGGFGRHPRTCSTRGIGASRRHRSLARE